MNPIPFQVGLLKFTIERHRTGFNRIHPSYYFYLEKNTGGRVLVLYAKKRAFNKTANYLISMVIIFPQLYVGEKQEFS